jgi:hypothetical protein
MVALTKKKQTVDNLLMSKRTKVTMLSLVVVKCESSVRTKTMPTVTKKGTCPLKGAFELFSRRRENENTSSADVQHQ